MCDHLLRDIEEYTPGSAQMTDEFTIATDGS